MASKTANSVVSSQNHKERIQELFMLSWLNRTHKILGSTLLPQALPLDMFSRPIHDSNSSLWQACVYTTQLFEACAKDRMLRDEFHLLKFNIDWNKKTTTSNICKLITAALNIKVLLKTPGTDEYAAQTHRSHLSAAALKQFAQLNDRNNAQQVSAVSAKLSRKETHRSAPAAALIPVVGPHKRASSVSPENLRLQSESEKSVDQELQREQESIMAAIRNTMELPGRLGTWQTMSKTLRHILELYDLEVREVPPAHVFDSSTDIPYEVKEHWRDMHAMVADSTMVGMEAILASVDTTGLQQPASFNKAKDALLRAVWKHEMDTRIATGRTRQYGKQAIKVLSKEWQVSTIELNLLFESCLRKDISALQAEMPAERYGQPEDMCAQHFTGSDGAELSTNGVTSFTISNGTCVPRLRATELFTRLMPYVEVHLHLLLVTNAGRDFVNTEALRSLLLSKAAAWAVKVGQKPFDLMKTVEYINRVRGSESVDDYIHRHTATIRAAFDQVVLQLSTIPQDVSDSFYQTY